MSRFDDLLNQIAEEAEHSAPAARHVRLNTTGWDGWIAPGEAISAPAATAADRYVPDAAPPVQADEKAPKVDLDAELEPTRLAVLSIRELGDLRRRLARSLHPDLAGHTDPDAMKRANAALDGEIRRRANGT